MNWCDLLKDGSKILFGGLLGFGFGWWGNILRERRDGARLRCALYQELANCYEAVLHHTLPDRTDFEFLKTKLKHEFMFVGFEAASRNPSALYGFAEHGWLLGCYRQLRNLCELAPATDDKDLVDLVKSTLHTIQHTPNEDARRLLAEALQPQYRDNIKVAPASRATGGRS